jgi:hypothetical protein
MAVRLMDNIAKPIGTLYCTADLRKDRCPAQIADNEHVTAMSACLRCEHSRLRAFKRGVLVSERGKKELQEKKEYVTEDVKA